MGVRTIDLTDFAVTTRKIKDGSVTLGTAVHYTTAGKLDGQCVSVTTDPTADYETEITHNLGRVPVGYIVVYQDKAGSLYRPDTGTAWTSTKFYIHCSAASVKVHLIIY